MTKKEVFQLFKAYYVKDINWTDPGEDGVSNTLHVVFGTMPFKLKFKNDILDEFELDMAFVKINNITFSGDKTIIGRSNGLDILKIKR